MTNLSSHSIACALLDEYEPAPCTCSEAALDAAIAARDLGRADARRASEAAALLLEVEAELGAGTPEARDRYAELMHSRALSEVTR